MRDISKPPPWCRVITGGPIAEPRIVGVTYGGWEAGIRVPGTAIEKDQVLTAAWQIHDAVLRRVQARIQADLWHLEPAFEGSWVLAALALIEGVPVVVYCGEAISDSEGRPHFRPSSLVGGNIDPSKIDRDTRRALVAIAAAHWAESNA